MPDRSLDEQISAILHEVVDATPPPPPFPTGAVSSRGAGSGVEPYPIDGTGAPPAGHRRRLVAVAVGMLGLVVLAVGLATRVDDTSTATSGTIAVAHEVVEYRQLADPACPDATVTGQFDSMTIETWSDLDNSRWRQEVRYPDGSSRTTIAFGNPAIPNRVFLQGERQGRTVRCGASGIVLTEPGQSSIYLIDPPEDLPAPPGLPEGGDYRNTNRGEQVPGEYEDSLGRSSQRWEQVITGFDDAGPITQTSTWWVDPATDRTLETSFVNDIDGPGRYTWTATLVVRDQQEIASTSFDPTGFTEITVSDTQAPTTTAAVRGGRPLPSADATEVQMRGEVGGDLGGTYASDGDYFRLIVSAPESPEFDPKRDSEAAGRTIIEIPRLGTAVIVCDTLEGPEQSGSLTWLTGGRRVQLRLFPSESAVCDPAGSLNQPLVQQAINMRLASDPEVEAFLREASP